MKKFIPVFLFVSVLAAPAAAGPVEDGERAYLQGNYDAALRLWRPLAEQGDPAAQFHLGCLYADGKGVPEDGAQALLWYRRAAEQGHIKAQHRLGLMYAMDERIPSDYVRAHKWWSLAAASGRQEARMLRDALKLRMSSEQIAEAEKLARDWRPKRLP